MPTLAENRNLADTVPTLLDGDPTPAKKAFLSTVIEVVDVGADRTLRPTIRVPHTPLNMGDDPNPQAAIEAVGEANETNPGRRHRARADRGSHYVTSGGGDAG